jgi:hypothetical protein
MLTLMFPSVIGIDGRCPISIIDLDGKYKKLTQTPC